MEDEVQPPLSLLCSSCYTPAKAQAYLLTILDAVQDGSVVFDP